MGKPDSLDLEIGWVNWLRRWVCNAPRGQLETWLGVGDTQPGFLPLLLKNQIPGHLFAIILPDRLEEGG
jgi:hypothetical protein